MEIILKYIQNKNYSLNINLRIYLILSIYKNLQKLGLSHLSLVFIL